MTCRACYLVRSRNKGKGKACPYSQAWLCETGNRYRTKVIFLLLELEGREEGLIPSILKHSPLEPISIFPHTTLNNLQNTVPWKLAIKKRCRHPLTPHTVLHGWEKSTELIFSSKRKIKNYLEIGTLKYTQHH